MKLASLFFSLRKQARRREVLSALAVVSAGLLLAEVNFIGSRHFWRYDNSAKQSFELHTSSKKLLASLPQNVRLTVALSRSDPLRFDLAELFANFQGVSSRVQTEFLDPERDLSRYRALLARAHAEGAEPELEDLVLFIESQGQLTALGKERLARLNNEHAQKSGLEAAILEEISQAHEEKLACFLRGQGEKSLLDQSPVGLSALARLLRRGHFQAEEFSLFEKSESCDALFVVGPTRPFSPQEAAELEKLQLQIPTFFFVDPIVDSYGRIVENGLASLFEKLGVQLPRAFVLERDPSLRLSQGLGEEFHANIKTHPLTELFHEGNQRRGLQLLVRASAPLELSRNAQCLAASSESAVLMNDLQSVEAALAQEASPGAPFCVVAAATSPTKAAIWGSSAMIENGVLEAESGNSVLLQAQLEALLSHAVFTPDPALETADYSLALSQEELNSLLRYVLLIIPLTSLLAGTALLLLRRRKSGGAP